MHDRFVQFLLLARWTSALVALCYHVRFLAFVNYDAVEEKNLLVTSVYFLTGLGHEAYAVFFILDGLFAGLILRQQRANPTSDAALTRHAAALYRLMLPGLMLGALFDASGARLFGQSGVYTAFPEFSSLAIGYGVFLGNLFMLQPFVVPNFGGNSMLYLLAYLFWSLVMLSLFVRAGALPTPYRRGVRIALLAAAAVFLPYQFLIWAAVWLAGVGLVFLAQARAWRPPVVAALALFSATLLLSRFLGPNTRNMEALLRDWVIQLGFAGVGLGFAALLWSLYPKQLDDDGACAVLDASGSWSAQAASFTFFFHFPVIMVLAGLGHTSLNQLLMQQPDTAWDWFASLAVASVAVALLVTGVFNAALRAMGGATQAPALRRQRGGRGSVS